MEVMVIVHVAAASVRMAGSENNASFPGHVT